MDKNSDLQRQRPFAGTLARLKSAGLRPTRQRLALGKLLFDAGDRHVTAEQLHGEADAQGIKVSLATVYNTLNQFSTSGLLREVVVAPGRSYFDTNVDDHHHFFYEDDATLQDIPGDQIALAALPDAPADAEVARVDVIVRLRRTDENRS
ncbi:MAG: transcriptional repressor [Alphaproteobacteria bacterium]|nr:transcriptional repressor [Alphaproteobacteria bacterium]|tara:strand:- start:400 stop:849 length:450 start_codon:yes stop_codon:yes gene_type:complete